MKWNKWYKILRIIMIILVIISICKNVFGAFSFTGYDDIGYVFPSLPKPLLNVNYNYLIMVNKSTGAISTYCYYGWRPYFDTNTNKLYWHKIENSLLMGIYFIRFDQNSNTWDVTSQDYNDWALQFNSVTGVPTNNPSCTDFAMGWSFPNDLNTTRTTIQYNSENVLKRTNDSLTSNIWLNRTLPSIVNSSFIQDWSFDNLELSLGCLDLQGQDYLTITYNGFTSELPIYNYSYSDNTILVPKQNIANLFSFVEQADMEIILTHFHGLAGVNDYNLGTYTISLTTDEAEDINNNTESVIQNSINNNTAQTNETLNNIQNTINLVHSTMTQGQQQTNAKIEQINNTITDDSVSSSANDLPSTNVNDITQNGIDNIFQSIYNAFCTGQAQDIVFPIPFTNKNITLSPNYVKDMLTNNGGTWVYTLIQVFWGYVIGRYIVKDISKKITKIKGGNIENIENENIKEEML